MAKTLKEKNQMECNKKAREKYDAKAFRYQSVKLKVSELEYINSYCDENNIPKNTLLRKAIMQYIGKPIEWQREYLASLIKLALFVQKYLIFKNNMY